MSSFDLEADLNPTLSGGAGRQLKNQLESAMSGVTIGASPGQQAASGGSGGRMQRREFRFQRERNGILDDILEGIRDIDGGGSGGLGGLGGGLLGGGAVAAKGGALAGLLPVAGAAAAAGGVAGASRQLPGVGDTQDERAGDFLDGSFGERVAAGIKTALDPLGIGETLARGVVDRLSQPDWLPSREDFERPEWLRELTDDFPPGRPQWLRELTEDFPPGTPQWVSTLDGVEFRQPEWVADIQNLADGAIDLSIDAGDIVPELVVDIGDTILDVRLDDVRDELDRIRDERDRRVGELESDIRDFRDRIGRVG